MIYYHGSRTSGMSSFKIEWTSNNPLGPGIYLSRDPVVADCYASTGGSIYEVKLSGNPNFTINLDASYRSQYVEAKEVIVKCLRAYDIRTPVKNNLSVRNLIHPHSHDRKEINRFLMNNGVWMIFGTLTSMESSGLQDRGVQYVVIDESRAVIKYETAFLEISRKLGLDNYMAL